MGQDASGRPIISEEEVECTNWNRFWSAIETAMSSAGQNQFVIVEGFQALHDTRVINASHPSNGNIRLYLDVSRDETIRRRSAPPSAKNPNSRPKQYCEQVLWPAHEKYYENTIKRLLVEQ